MRLIGQDLTGSFVEKVKVMKIALLERLNNISWSEF